MCNSSRYIVYGRKKTNVLIRNILRHTLIYCFYIGYLISLLSLIVLVNADIAY